MVRFKVQLDLDVDVDGYARAQGATTAVAVSQILATLRNRATWEPRLNGRHVSVHDARAQLELFGTTDAVRLSDDDLPDARPRMGHDPVVRRIVDKLYPSE